MWIVIGIAALYFIYLPFSLFWSGIDKGNGMKRSVTLLKTVKKDLELLNQKWFLKLKYVFLENLK